MSHVSKSPGGSASTASDAQSGTKASGCSRRLAVDRRSGLSFWTVSRTARGRVVSECAFDVPLQDYGEGWATGLAVAGEYFAALQSGPPFEAIAPIRAAVEARESSLSTSGASKLGAAAAFLSVLDAVVRAAALQMDHQGYIAAEAQRLREVAAARASRKQGEKREFVDRMRASKAAKVARLQPSVQTGGVQ